MIDLPPFTLSAMSALHTFGGMICEPPKETRGRGDAGKVRGCEERERRGKEVRKRIQLEFGSLFNQFIWTFRFVLLTYGAGVKAMHGLSKKPQGMV